MQINLRDVPFYYLNVQTRTDRRRHVEQQLRGFIHDRIDGTPSPLLGARKDRPFVLAPLGHAKVIEHAVRRMGKTFEPFVLCEDDIAWRVLPEACTPVVVTAPDYADAVYLGISACACRNDVNDYCYDIIRERSIDFPHLQRIYNMLTAHAVLFLSFRHCLAYAQAMIESCAVAAPCDCLSNRLFSRHEVFAYGEPLFYQAAVVGGQEGPTNIAWTDGGTVQDRFAARSCHNVHPFSTLVSTPISKTLTVAVPVAGLADIQALASFQPTQERKLVVCLAEDVRRDLYQCVRDMLPHAAVLLTDLANPIKRMSDLCRVNPHDAYGFVCVQSGADAQAFAFSDLRVGAVGEFPAGSAEIAPRVLGGDLDALLEFTADPARYRQRNPLYYLLLRCQR